MAYRPVQARQTPRVFPFSAIVGQNQAKLALTLALIDPGMGGVLLSGVKGTAKSTLVRALPGIVPPLMDGEPVQVAPDALVEIQVPPREATAPLRSSQAMQEPCRRSGAFRPTCRRTPSRGGTGQSA